MPRIRALTNWSGRKVGEEWDASEEDARLLCACDLVGGQRAEYTDRAMRAASSSPAPAAPQPSPDKKRYMRRDLRADT
jgi:hypothetical protein